MATTHEDSSNYTVNTVQSLNFNFKNQKKGNVQIWHQAIENKRVDILGLLNHHQTFLDEKCATILEDKAIGGKPKLLDQDKSRKDEKNNSNSSILPARVQKKINKIKQLNKDLKEQVEEISKLNAAYVINQGGKYINIENQNKPNESNLPSIPTEVSKNFRYINDNYRTQLMRAFLNYNPKIHHANLLSLVEKDPLIQK
jgi:hypothetical protein